MIRLGGKSSRLKSTFNPLSQIDPHCVRIVCDRSEIFKLHDRVLFENWVERGQFQAWSGEIVEVKKIKDYHVKLGVRKRQEVTIVFSGTHRTYEKLYNEHLRQRSPVAKMKTLIKRFLTSVVSIGSL